MHKVSRDVALSEVAVAEFNCILLILIIKIYSSLNIIVDMVLNKGESDE